MKSFCLCILVLAVCGCEKKSAPVPEKGAGAPVTQPGLVVGAESKALSELAATDIVVSVNGVALTRKGYDDLLRSVDQMYRAKNPNLQPAQWEFHRKQRARTLVSEFLTKQVLLAEAHRLNLKPSPENLASLRGVLEDLAKTEGVKVEELATSSNPDVRRMTEGVEEQALIMTLRDVSFGGKLTVTDADMETARKRIERYNAMCEQTNALVKARATAICERLRKGEDFVGVAAEVSETKEDVKGVWGSFVRHEIQDAQVRHAAFTLPVGGVSEPFDTEDGMVIIKVLERSGIDSPVATSEATVKLGRILLRLGETIKRPSDAELRRELETNRLTQMQKPWLDALQKKVRIEFPNGTNLWKKVDSKKVK